MGILRTDKISGLEKEKGQNPNLVANGDFSEASTIGWTGYNAVISYDSGAGGRLKVDDSAAAGGWSNAAYVVNTEPGASYRFEVRASASDSDTHFVGYYQGTYDTAGTVPTQVSSEVTTRPAVVSFDLIATGSTVTIMLIANNNGVVYYDDVSFRKTDGNSIGGSVHFDGNDHLSIGASGNYNFLHNGLTDWTAEFWAKMPSVTRGQVFGTGASSAQTGFSLTLMSSADNQSDKPGVFAMFGRGAAGNYRYWGTSNGLSINTWHHIAAVFKSSDKTLALYIDGREVDNDSGTENGTFGSGNYSSSNHSYAFTVAKNIHSSTFFTGYISNLRVVAGRRLYTSDFTPPVHELEPIDGTAILCCNNPDSVTAVSNAGIGTAHIGTSSGNPANSTENPGLTRDFTSGTEFKGVTTFDTQGYFVPPSGTTTDRDSVGGRGVIKGEDNAISYISISSQGNSKDFGDLTVQATNTSACASSTRGLFSAGYNHPLYHKIIDYVTIATTGNATSFGEITTGNSYVYGMGGCSSPTRGLFGGGFSGPSPDALSGVAAINYVTIASLGNSQSFGDLTAGVRYPSATSSPIRGIFGGGRDSPNGNRNIISYVTIATTGDATDFGDLTYSPYGQASTGSSTRGMTMGGYNPAGSAAYNNIDYFTIASTGNAQDFGNLNVARGGLAATSNAVRGTFAGGNNVPTNTNHIDYVTIASTGNATNFGDLTSSTGSNSACSNSHGGIS